MLIEARWHVIEKLLQRLIAADFPPDIACDIVTLIEIDLDNPEDTIFADLNEIADQHANDLIAVRERLYTMLRRTMNTKKSPALHRIPELLDIMLRNVARQYRISLSA